jgi:stress-induced morphogen
MSMDLAEIEELIEGAIEDAEATVRRARGPEDDDHLEALVVSPAFEGVSLVEQHQMVHEALEGRLTRDIHALELRTRTPEEQAEHGSD